MVKFLNGELLKALWWSLPRNKYACGGEVRSAVFPMPRSLQVQGAGNFALPLGKGDFSKLRDLAIHATYDRRDGEILITDIRRAWQVDGSSVSCPEIPDFFSKVVKDLAATSLAEDMGIDSTFLNLDVNLYKLILYEVGHFKHRDTDKEPGMFATMILQLPTESGYEGGQFEIRHDKQSQTFDFSGPASSIRYFKTLFFCDCKHKLEKVTKGHRLCLVFSLRLVRNNPKFVGVDDENVPSFISALSRVQSLLKQWADLQTRPMFHPVERSSSKVPESWSMLVIPLAHKYPRCVSIPGLKGYDRVVAALVLSCCSFLDVRLCMLKKQETSNENLETTETKYVLDDWKSLKDTFRKGDCEISIADVLRCSGDEDDPFDIDAPDMEETEPYHGNHGADKTRRYHSPALVVWPTTSFVVSLLEKEHSGCSFKSDLAKSNVQECVRVFSSVRDRYSRDWYPEELLRLCLDYGLDEEVIMIMKELGLHLTKSKEGVAVLAAVLKKIHGRECRDIVEGFATAVTAVDFKYDLISFPEALSSHGLQDLAASFAKKLLPVLIAEKFVWIGDLLKFMMDSGLKEETLSALDDKLIGTRVLASIVQRWGDSIPLVESLWEKELNLCKGEVAKSVIGRMRRAALFVLELEKLGCHEAAVSFKKLVVGVGVAEKLRDLILPRARTEDVLVLALFSSVQKLDAFVKTELRDHYSERRGAIESMRKAARLIGLKEDDKITKVFADLCFRELDIKGDEVPGYISEDVFWLGDETLLEAVTSRKKSWRSMTCDEIEALAEDAASWPDAGRNALKKLAENRVEFLLTQPELGQSNSKEELFNPRIDRLDHDRRVEAWKEQADDEIEKLHEVLNDLSHKCK